MWGPMRALDNLAGQPHLDDLRETKVGDFEVTTVPDQEVLGLQVTVHDLFGV